MTRAQELEYAQRELDAVRASILAITARGQVLGESGSSLQRADLRALQSRENELRLRVANLSGARRRRGRRVVPES